ncbi:MAG: hypothetical protein OCD02_06260 [Spirochaetaceae bacterium]
MKKMSDYIKDDIVGQLKYYFDLVTKDKLNLEVDGIKAFNPKSQFVEGKVINAFSYIYETLDSTDEIPGIEQNLMDIIDLMSLREYETWGMLNCITSINRLHSKKMLNKVISPEALERFKEKLDWRTFVNIGDLTLINLPTNYYGVAFGVAKYRELLGFEPVGYSDKLLEKLLKHVDSYSGEFSYMDETLGQGRFDRYSTLIPAEICSMLHNTGQEIPDKLTSMLRKSCELYLNLANIHGHGFSYGRSIGAYGDTASLEVLSIGAKLGILKSEEIDLAYSYSTAIIDKFVNFWIDPKTKSLNMWDNGRATDTYRNKNRILGENLSLSMQIISSYEYWNESGYENIEPLEDLEEKLKELPRISRYKFAEGDYSRSLYIVRDENHVFSLPIINGAKKYYKETPYLPIPNEFNVFTSAANSSHPNLIPKLIFEDGTEVMPLVYINDIKDNLDAKNSDEFVVEINVDKLTTLKEESPVPFDGFSATIKYTFKKNNIKSEVVFNNSKSVPCTVEMEFASFGTNPLITDQNVLYKDSDITNVKTMGFDKCYIKNISADDNYSTPIGGLKSVITWTSSDFKQLKFSWDIDYK